MKILIADDDPVSLKMLEVTVKGLGHEVTCVTSGERAWDSYRACPVPIVISDWIMPEMTGETPKGRSMSESSSFLPG